MTTGHVHHVGSLDEALSLYAAARAVGSPLPTFTTTLAKWPSVRDDVSNSYTLEHRIGETRVLRWTGVMIHVDVLEDDPSIVLPEHTTLQ